MMKKSTKPTLCYRVTTLLQGALIAIGATTLLLLLLATMFGQVKAKMDFPDGSGISTEPTELCMTDKQFLQQAADMGERPLLTYEFGNQTMLIVWDPAGKGWSIARSHGQGYCVVMWGKGMKPYVKPGLPL